MREHSVQLPTPAYQRGDVRLYRGDCRDVLATFPEAFVATTITDPPYGLEFMGKEWDKLEPARNKQRWKGQERRLIGDGSGKGGDFGSRMGEMPQYRPKRNPRCRACKHYKFSGSPCNCKSPDWDYRSEAHSNSMQAWHQQWAEAVLRVCLPGAMLLSFGGTRTFHRLVCAIEDAGWEPRDTLMWLYGCLSADTEVLIDGEWCSFDKALPGRRALCYNADEDTYGWLPIEDSFVYPYADTAYRIYSDHTDQLVTRNHRCLVERGGAFRFQIAEEMARESETRVPVLESMQGLLRDLPVHDQGAGCAQSVLLAGMYSAERETPSASFPAERSIRGMCCMREGCLETRIPHPSHKDTDMLLFLQRQAARQRMGATRIQGARRMDSRIGACLCRENARRDQSFMERRGNVFSEARSIQADKVRAMPNGFPRYGPKGRVCDGASPISCESTRASLTPHGSSTPHKPRSARQSAEQPSVVRVEPATQTVRASRYTRTDLVRCEPVYYAGIVWCVRVPTGAFVVRRNGKVFVTGNSGFPKSHDISKAIDKAAGAEREVVAHQRLAGNACVPTKEKGGTYGVGVGVVPPQDIPITAPATEAAKLWDGWGTALKPSFEPITLAMKPLDGSFAANALKHGVAGLNIDGGRVPTGDGKTRARPPRHANAIYGNGKGTNITASEHNPAGRWPSNLIHDGSREVVERFPETGISSGGKGERSQQTALAGHVYGKYSGEHLGQNAGGLGDSGSAARFFYCAKASPAERGKGNRHPTVKPLALMRYLAKLTRTPTGGMVLDPFLGSGTTAVACIHENRPCIGIELEQESFDTACRRVDAAFDEYGLLETHGGHEAVQRQGGGTFQGGQGY